MELGFDLTWPAGINTSLAIEYEYIGKNGYSR